MSPEQQRIKIAEACGWTEISERCMWGLPPNATDDGTEDCLRHFPKYESDLNAMNNALAYLTPEQLRQWAVKLTAIVLENNIEAWWDLDISETAQVLTATAAQRAEAFLKTLNLWTEE